MKSYMTLKTTLKKKKKKKKKKDLKEITKLKVNTLFNPFFFLFLLTIYLINFIDKSCWAHVPKTLTFERPFLKFKAR